MARGMGTATLVRAPTGPGMMVCEDTHKKIMLIHKMRGPSIPSAVQIVQQLNTELEEINGRDVDKNLLAIPASAHLFFPIAFLDSFHIL